MQYLILLEITSVTGDENARETLENQDEMNRNRGSSYNEKTSSPKRSADVNADVIRKLCS